MPLLQLTMEASSKSRFCEQRVVEDALLNWSPTAINNNMVLCMSTLGVKREDETEDEEAKRMFVCLY